MKYFEEDGYHYIGEGYWIYVPSWIVRAYRLINRFKKPRGNLDARVVLRIAEKGEALIKQRKHYHFHKSTNYYRENWDRKLLREERGLRIWRKNNI